MKFLDTTDEEQKAVAEKVKKVFEECHIKTNTVEPFAALFGKHNVIGYIEHPAFINGRAILGLFDGITGLVKIDTGITVKYGGLDFDADTKMLDIDKDIEEIQNRLYWMRILVDRIKEEPMTREIAEKFKLVT